MHSKQRHSFCMPGRTADLISALCAVFMLCVVPLLFHDAFFDINRFKVNAVLNVVPALCLIRAGISFYRRSTLSDIRRGVGAPSVCMLLFLVFCVIACARIGFPRYTLTGENGRYCGLLFLLSCGAAYYLISLGAFRLDAVVYLAILTGALVAGLGVLNTLGVDPLGFYANIKRGQEHVFLSTIGHFDFFGTFLILLFGLAAGYSVFAKKRSVRMLTRLAAAVMALGMSTARTDSAFLGLHLVCFAVTALSGGCHLHFARSLMLWAIGMISIPAMYMLLPMSPYGAAFSGLPLFLCESGAALIVSCAMALLSIIFYALHQRGVRVPGRNSVQKIFAAVFVAAVLALLLVIVFFSVFAQDAPLPAAASILRFNDVWGSLRGFVYIRSLRAYGDYSLAEKLFGRGLETTLSILTPYFDRPEMLTFGVFNDTHCQPLQMLLTCGAFGMLAFIAFYVSMLVTVIRRAGEDPLLCGAFCSLAGYLIILAINVTQPILISTYFAICAVAVCRIQTNRREENRHES